MWIIFKQQKFNLRVLLSICLIFCQIQLSVLLIKKTCDVQKQPLEVFCKKRCSWDFAKFTGKLLCKSLFFDKIAGLRHATSLKKRLWHRFFPVSFAKFPGTPFFIEQLWWLLLKGKNLDDKITKKYRLTLHT